MKITREFIEQHRTAKGGFTFAQCKALGAGYPPERGWLKRAVQVEHTEEAIALFVAYKDRAATKPERRAQRKERWEALRTLDAPKTITPQQKKNQRRKSSNIYPPRPVTLIQPYKGDPSADAFLSSFEWRKTRMVALKKYGARCQCCGASPETGAVIHVDHIKPRRLFPQLALDVENLQILCMACNHGKGSWDMTDWRPSEDIDDEAAQHLRSIMRDR